MGKNIKKYSLFLVTVQMCCLLTPSHAMFDIFGGGGGGVGMGGSDVAEILAAGLITKMLMDDFLQFQGAPLIQSLRHQFIGGFSPRHPVHHPVPRYPQMIAPRVPMAMSAQYAYPIVQRYPIHMMSQSSYMPQARHPMVAAPWNGPYRASASYANAYLPVQRASNTPPFIEALLTNEALSAATLLLNSNILGDDEEEDEEVAMREEEVGMRGEEEEDKSVPEIPEKEAENRSETFETSASEHESRYILPRIVRHFVQRIMRRVEQQ